MVNISGGGVIKYSKNKYNAQLLLEFMISPEAQIMYTTKNYEYPILESVKMSNILERWGDYKSDEKSLKDLMQYMSLAIQIADEEGWK
jgi:iron(III) transport system substrate-binding protein